MSVVVPFPRPRYAPDLTRDAEVSASDAAPRGPRIVTIEQDLLLPADELKRTVDGFIACLLIFAALAYAGFTGMIVYGASMVFGTLAAWTLGIIFAGCIGFFAWRYFATPAVEVVS